jgi:hypothetical protein
VIWHRPRSFGFYGEFELPIPSETSISGVEVDYLIRLNRGSFENGAFPRMVGTCWQCEAKAIAHLDRCGREQLASSFLSNDRCELVLSREGDNHLSRAGSMAIDEQNNPSMERLRAQPFGFEDDGLLRQHWARKT